MKTIKFLILIIIILLALQPSFSSLASPSKQEDIPLTPKNGGWSIDDHALEIGDIIVTTSDEWGSRAIRLGTWSNVSHAMLYVGDGLVVEAITDPVQEVVLRPLEEAIENSTLAVAFRYPDLSELDGMIVRDYAGRQIGKPYDYLGLVEFVDFTMNYGQNSVFFAFVDDENAFFCSELIISAYEDAGIQLVEDVPDHVSPGDIARLRFDSTLEYVGHLKWVP